MKHNFCNYVWEVEPNSFLNRGSRCSNCYGNILKTHEQFAREVFEISDGEYEVLEKYINSKTKIEILHNECGNSWRIDPSSFLVGNRCPFCKHSKGEHRILKFLDKHSIAYVREVKFDNCIHKRKLPFDFYLEDYELLIEYDSILHYEDKFNDPEQFKLVQKRDQIKTKYCEDNNINLLRIPYWEFDNIEKILTDYLLS